MPTKGLHPIQFPFMSSSLYVVHRCCVSVTVKTSCDVPFSTVRWNLVSSGWCFVWHQQVAALTLRKLLRPYLWGKVSLRVFPFICQKRERTWARAVIIQKCERPEGRRGRTIDGKWDRERGWRERVWQREREKDRKNKKHAILGGMPNFCNGLGNQQAEIWTHNSLIQFTPMNYQCLCLHECLCARVCVRVCACVCVCARPCTLLIKYPVLLSPCIQIAWV